MTGSVSIYDDLRDSISNMTGSISIYDDLRDSISNMTGSVSIYDDLRGFYIQYDRISKYLW